MVILWMPRPDSYNIFWYIGSCNREFRLGGDPRSILTSATPGHHSVEIQYGVSQAGRPLNLRNSDALQATAK